MRIPKEIINMIQEKAKDMTEEQIQEFSEYLAFTALEIDLECRQDLHRKLLNIEPMPGPTGFVYINTPDGLSRI